jgi:hypothetical protein
MSGFIYDPLQTINLIADNVRDRYRDETAVPKEIAQNADDAQVSRPDFIIVTEGLQLHEISYCADRHWHRERLSLASGRFAMFDDASGSAWCRGLERHLS